MLRKFFIKVERKSLESFDSVAPFEIVPEKSIQFFFKISVFLVMSQTDFWKTHPNITTQNSLNILYLLNSRLWISFPGIGFLASPKILKSAIGSVSSPEISSAHAPKILGLT